MFMSVSPSSSEHVYYSKMVERLHALRPGEKLVYFEGFLDSERLNNPFGPACMCANIAYDLAQRGRMTLTQKRKSLPQLRNGTTDWTYGMGEGFFYIAIGIEPKQRR